MTFVDALTARVKGMRLPCGRCHDGYLTLGRVLKVNELWLIEAEAGQERFYVLAADILGFTDVPHV